MSPALFKTLYWQAQSSHPLTSAYAKRQLKKHFPEKEDVINYVNKHNLGKILEQPTTGASGE